jgi:phage terminase large subunit-like protein
MAGLIVPAPDAELWPTLGLQVADWIECNLVFGPGDLRGQPARLDDEKRALLARMYEVYPPDHPQAGRRRFRRVALSLRKGTAKTEFAAWISAAELHPAAPVRCTGWDVDGNPIGGGVTDPYIPMVAYTEEQSEDLAYYALRVILDEGPLKADFDIGIERIMRRGGDGKAVALASSPDARDGARTTFQHFDETHRFTLPRLKAAHRTMLANLPKRRLADPWALETTTAPEPGSGSVAEATMDYARLVENGERTDSRLFFFHRQAGDGHDLTTKAGVRAAVIEASGPVASWSDIDGIVEQWDDPTSDQAYLERVWLNRLVRGSERAFDTAAWKALAEPREIPPKELITLGFDGARTRDATALVATHVESGYQWLVGLWERPTALRPEDSWEVPAGEVDEAVTACFERWDVWRMYLDPPYWETWADTWHGRWGGERVLYWYTLRTRPMAFAIAAFQQAIAAGELRHDGHPDLTRHIGNAMRRPVTLRDDNDRPMWLIQKERPDSPHKIDAAMASILSWEARGDAIKAGAQTKHPSPYKTRGPRVVYL